MQLAQQIIFPGGNITGPLPPDTKFTNLASVVSLALPYIFPIAGVTLLIYLILGGFTYLTSMGDPKKAAAGQAKITNAIVGFIIIFVAYWIVWIVDYLFGLKLYN